MLINILYKLSKSSSTFLKDEIYSLILHLKLVFLSSLLPKGLIVNSEIIVKPNSL